MQETLAKINAFLENQKSNISNIFILLGLVDVLFAAFFLPQYLHTRQFRNYMVFGSPMQAESWLQFLKFGWGWLAFADIFLFLPVIVISMILPHMLELLAAAQDGEE
ncbi:MAG: hypothetical protein M1383_05840 [Patescibacteria group bacterium]|nr:hypothetical protein [Patescibacteria group bacterium]